MNVEVNAGVMVSAETSLEVKGQGSGYLADAIEVDGYKFLPSAILVMAKGKEEDRKVCPVCGREKYLKSWICEPCIKAAENRGKILFAVKKAVAEAGGDVTLERPGQGYMNKEKTVIIKIDDEIFQEMVNVCIGHLTQTPKAEVRDLIKFLNSLYEFPSPTLAGAAKKALGLFQTQVQKQARHQSKWQEACAAVELWLKEEDERMFDIREAPEIADDLLHDESFKVAVYKNMLIAAFIQVKKSLYDAWKAEFFQKCVTAVKLYVTNSDKLEKASAVARDVISKAKLPPRSHSMVMRAVCDRLIDLKKEAGKKAVEAKAAEEKRREAERERLAKAGQDFFHSIPGRNRESDNGKGRMKKNKGDNRRR